ncbi:MAG: alcohol dehydrogenase catalytic domain-containing protein, partial [Nitrospinota bacterium]
MKDMRVAMYYSNEDIRLEQMPVPSIGEGELLVRVLASGICGSDVMGWYREKSAPRVLGHEVSAEVVDVGNGVIRFSKGDRVVVTHHVPCNSCYYCLEGNHTLCDTLRTTNFDPGGFSEFLRVPRINVDRGVFLLPDSVSDDEGTFVEPLGCVIRGLRVAGFKAGQRVLIIGSGISGLLHINLLKMLGAGRVIAVDVNDGRLKAAKKFGADHVIKAGEKMPEELVPVNGNRLPDLVVVC